MDELVNVINTLLSTLLVLVPEKYQPLAKALMALGWAIGGVWAGVRLVIAKKLPAGREPGWFQAVDIVMQAITASSSRVSTRPLPLDEEKKK